MQAEFLKEDFQMRNLNSQDIKSLIENHKEYLKHKFYVESIGLVEKGKERKEAFNRMGNDILEEEISIVVTFSKPVGLEFFGLKGYLDDLIGEDVNLIPLDFDGEESNASLKLSEVEYL